jgi:hypothetical protein
MFTPERGIYEYRQAHAVGAHMTDALQDTQEESRTETRVASILTVVGAVFACTFVLSLVVWLALKLRGKRGGRGAHAADRSNQFISEDKGIQQARLLLESSLTHTHD